MKDNKIPLEPQFHRAEEPEEGGFYETGNTRPPKSHKQFLVIAMVACIVLGGFLGIFAMLNISLAFRRQENHALAFRPETETEAQPSETTTEPAVTLGQEPIMALRETPDSVPNIPQEGGLSLQEIYEKAAPSVVSVRAGLEGATSSGSGIIMSQDGYVITNCHVVEGAGTVTVTLFDGTAYGACVVGCDSLSDLAVLRIDAEGLTPAEFGSSDGVQVGDSVVAIGSPLGDTLSGTMTDGIISAINRNVVVGGKTMTLLQTNAALNSGNSGGPLINCYGQVIGITTAKVGDSYSSAGVEGLGFAIPMSGAKEILEQLTEFGYVPGRASLGLELKELPALYSLYYNLPQGLLITEVAAGSSAQAAGLEPRDILIQVEGESVITKAQVQSILEGRPAGDRVTLTIYHQGGLYSVEIALEEARG